VKPGYLSEIFVSFQGEGAHVGRRHLFVRLAGCNMRCRYCDTPDSLERSAHFVVHDGANPPLRHSNPVAAITLARLVEEILEREAPIDALALTGGEPLTQSEFLAAFLDGARFAVPVLLETNGVLPRRLREVLPWVDIVSMDVKLPSNTGEGGFWDEHAAFLNLAHTKEVYAKILVDEGTADADLERAAALLASVEPVPPAFLQPIADGTGRCAIRAERLAHLYRLARRRVPSLRVLPQTHKLLGIR
jgi:7-carboxy-7-deazaguanine synthase